MVDMSIGGCNVVTPQVVFTDNPMSTKKPKSDDIRTVKLTEDSIRSVAAHILKTVGGMVSVDDSGIVVDGEWPTEFFLGNWVVEEYDYDLGEIRFRKASRDERESYDLR